MTQAILFDPGREGFLKGEIRWDGTAVIKMSLCRGYTFSAAHKFVSDLSGVTQVATVTLGTQTATNGVADAADAAFTAVGAGAACTQLIIFQASAVTGGADVATSAQRLIAYIDNATGLPVTPNGGDINFTFDSGGNRIFKL
jgi:hypothetical protein